MGFTPQDPKSCASASSATPAVVALFYKLGKCCTIAFLAGFAAKPRSLHGECQGEGLGVAKDAGLRGGNGSIIRSLRENCLVSPRCRADAPIPKGACRMRLRQRAAQ